MVLTRKILIQVAVFIAISIVAIGVMAFSYMRLPNLLFGAGHYRVTLELPETGGLYERSNVTYRGSQVGRVEKVGLTERGTVEAVLSLESGVAIPADLDAAVHSQTAVGELFVELLPRTSGGPDLRDGDVIPLDRTTVPMDVNTLLDATNRGLQAIPGDNLRTAVDEAYLAVGGLGPDLNRLVKGSTALAIDARANLDPLTALIDQSKPVLDSQTDTAGSIRAWASNLATVTAELRDHDGAVRSILQQGPGAAEEVRALLDRLQPTLPIVLANLVNINEVAIAYQPALEQLLVLLPQGTATTQATGTANRNTKQDYKGAYLNFNLNLNLPPACTTGFLPAQQQRVAALEDYPDRPAGDLYCRIPQDSPNNVRGARNLPCITVPGKRAPTVAMCESDETYVPLNDGNNWKGDPNATLSGQAVPQLRPGQQPAETVPAPAPEPPAVAAAEYDPASGTYVGPDGKVYTQSNLGRTANEEQTWQTMLLPPPGK
ncbi:MAG: MlaD family protein [Mycolicibacterium neoaurum]|uniref:MCE family protein n=1 Tax=Mycolicibacterium neoaurum TaxID=1795 RepID=UPI0005646EFC|nr:MlaD family protein [Mycolicibacterium neoaurum]SDE48419.1 phospholipid/cholesterol/gamma-HCH transport system substrate-binding protein [Mycolicibacterium neoaurum]